MANDPLATEPGAPSTEALSAPTGPADTGVIEPRRDVIPMLVLLSIGATLAVGLALSRFGADAATLGAGLCALLFLLAVVRLPSNVDAWRVATDPDQQTSLVLRRLVRSGFVILHGRRMPGSRQAVDHIVIGPTGVWLIETDHSVGRVAIGGDKVVVVRKAAALARVMSTELSAQGLELDLPVRPAVCFHRARLPLFRRESGGAAVTDGRGLSRLLARSPHLLDADGVQAVAAILDRALAVRARAAAK